MLLSERIIKEYDTYLALLKSVIEYDEEKDGLLWLEEHNEEVSNFTTCHRSILKMLEIKKK